MLAESRDLPPGQRRMHVAAGLADLVVRHRILVAVLPELIHTTPQLPEFAGLTAGCQELPGLLADPDDPSAGPALAFALLGLSAFCRSSAGLEDASLHEAIGVALTRLLAPATAATPPAGGGRQQREPAE